MFKRRRAAATHSKKSHDPCLIPDVHGAGGLHSHCLQLGALFKRSAHEPGAFAAAQLQLAALGQQLEAEQQRHAATTACLQQEQEMLAILAARLAAVETLVGCQGSGLSHVHQMLRDEQHLHDIALRALIQQRRLNCLLKQQLESMQDNSISTTSSCSQSASSSKRMAFRTACAAAGGLAAATCLTTSAVPEAVSALAWPLMTAAMGAKATAAALRTLGCLHRVLWCKKQPAVPPPGLEPTISCSIASGLRSFNCWEQGDVILLACPSDISSSSSGRSSSSSELLDSPDSPDCTVLHDWDDVQSVLSFDGPVDAPAGPVDEGAACVLAWVMAAEGPKAPADPVCGAAAGSACGAIQHDAAPHV